MTALFESPARKETVGFDVDAMLMYGWVADADRKITHVSNSLRRWILDHGRSAADANVKLAEIDAGGTVTVVKFLASLLDPKIELGTPEMVDGFLTRLKSRLDNRQGVPERTEELCNQYTVRLQYKKPEKDAQPLLGARFLRDAATLLISGQNADRVDIVVVAIAKPHDGWYQIEGFQGQFQEAFLRVQNKVTDGNRAGGIALMARNLSHNIGSHALYWVAADADDDRYKKFFNYLQMRMELLAGFATSMPFSAVPADVGEVVREFAKTKLLLNNISRSEAVTNVSVRYSGDATEALFFGGRLGIQAFYSILENCIRDSCKHVRRISGSASMLTLYVHAEIEGDFVRIDVHDGECNFEQDGAFMRDALLRLKLSDESGKLVSEHWGIKERFVCAAMLRGYRPEDFSLMESGRDESPLRIAYDGHPILDMVEVGGKCVWRFYLPRRSTEVLLVTDRQLESTPSNIEVRSIEQFKRDLESPTAITAPFVVLDGFPPGLGRNDLEPRLPHRTFVLGDVGDTRFTRLNDPLEAISPQLLLQRSVEQLQLVQQRSVDQLPAARLVIADKPGELGAFTVPAEFSDPPTSVVDTRDIETAIAQIVQKYPEQKLVVFRRHEMPAYVPNTSMISHYEEEYTQKPYLLAAIRDYGVDPRRAAYRLLECALTKILIIDERIDLKLFADATGSQRASLLRRGIAVRGREFAGHMVGTPVRIGQVSEWASDFHFVLLHLGIVDKLRKSGSGLAAEKIVAALEAGGRRVIIHSGRMGMRDLPQQTKFLSLANLTSWIEQGYPKLQIIDEIFSLRRV